MAPLYEEAGLYEQLILLLHSRAAPRCCRNRQVQAFYDVIQWFKPAFVLMENVMDIFHKQNGMYVKFAVGRLLNMRYQTRVGCIAAADQGAPQGRWRRVPSTGLLRAPFAAGAGPEQPPPPAARRAFLWGALAGQEQLPPFPEPSHFASWQCGVPELARQSVVGFTSEDARTAAHTMVRGTPVCVHALAARAGNPVKGMLLPCRTSWATSCRTCRT